MEIILYCLIFCIGTVFGSFFTLAVYRIPLKQDITHERSYCPNCNHKLSFFDMIPLLSYIFLGGKCRYCKAPIRIRYFLLELLSGSVFLLFAISIKLPSHLFEINTIFHFVIGLLYLATLFIIAGIDKEKIHIEKSVLLFGILVQACYIVYLYIVEGFNTNIYRYVIYLVLVCAFIMLDIIKLRKSAQTSYICEILILCMLMIIYTYEYCFILTICLSIFIIIFINIINKMSNKRVKYKKQGKKTSKMPIGFYLICSNIVVLVLNNLYIFYR